MISSKNRTTILFCAFTAVLILAGCAGNKEDIKEAVTLYTGLLTEAYNRQNITPLAVIASEPQMEKVYNHISSFQEGGVRMETELIDLSLKKSEKISEDSWKVKTIETWSYAYFHIQSGSLVTKNRVRYDLIYTVERQDANWMIESIEVLSSDELEKGAELIFLQRPEKKKQD